MSIIDQLEAALDGLEEGQHEVQIHAGELQAEVVLTDLDRLGATVDRLRVRRERPGDVTRQVETLPERLRTLGNKLTSQEVAPSLGGAVLRTAPEAAEGDRFWEVNIREQGRSAELERYAVNRETGRRDRETFTVTRQQLGRIVDGLMQGMDED